ncbi:NAD(P)H-dependent oxidoreductase [Holzapfeliella floricola]|uniref:NADPH-flavin oxidoreductase n=1 Tax=Holzapfeliella floricola DSM 23037 = JCM 16512 TaxID=1423744 RepID=A0A0R2DVW5_9LACO|nr:NAD(P)H-dependent oxidoreductase [Holzapfeliella floricola]KRN04764.1 NADPH-flavin oxidoreductase [Holzapfeliella floricola DSM 23037 = JCM 16512]
MTKNQQILNVMNRRYATKSFDSNKKISDSDWETIVEAGRLSPSSLGFSPWKILLIKNDTVKEDLKDVAWGANPSLTGASHFVIFLARKDVTPTSDYIKHFTETVSKRTYDPESPFLKRVASFQRNDFKLDNAHDLYHWAAKQTYITLANMMTTAAFLDIDSCPIEGFDIDKVEDYLSQKGILDREKFGVSLMAGFGYRNEEITPKKRLPLSEIYDIID